MDKELFQTEKIDQNYFLQRKSDKLLCKYWWSESPFDRKQDLKIPIYSYRDQTFTNEYIHLYPLIFNQPIRRDLIHKTFKWVHFYGKKTTHRTPKPFMIPGSGRKVRPQKGTGRARMGTIRAGNRINSGKIFGHIPKDFTTALPNLLKLKALSSMLSAKLAEGKLIITNNDSLDYDNVKTFQDNF